MKNIFNLCLLLVLIISLLAETAVSQTRPRQVSQKNPQELVRLRRVLPSSKARTISEKRAAKQVDSFLANLDQLIRDYLQPIKTQPRN